MIGAAALLLAALLATPGGVASAQPAVSATAAVLVDARTGQVLYARNPHLRRPPASTTKILTALVALDRLPLDATIRVSKRAELSRAGSAIGLTEGETYRFRDLLYALLVPSANDAAVALAEAVGGTVAGFAAMMNDAAAALGARDSHFTNPDGLHDPGHYTSAYDLALFARAAIGYPIFSRAVSRLHYEFAGPAGPREVWGKNKLLWKYPGADGIKTGWVAESGPCLVGSATRGGRRLIAVVLNSGDEYGDAMRLLSYGFDRFAQRVLAPSGTVVARLQVPDAREGVAATVDRDVVASVLRGRAPRLTVLPRPGLRAPIGRGTVVGTAIYSLDGEAAARADLVAAVDVPALSWWARLLEWLRRGG